MIRAESSETLLHRISSTQRNVESFKFGSGPARAPVYSDPHKANEPGPGKYDAEKLINAHNKTSGVRSVPNIGFGGEERKSMARPDSAKTPGPSEYDPEKI